MLFFVTFFHVLQMRAQANVLKKAVVEEQTRNSELRDVLKERDQSLRKVEQEMDSLTFRNQQLTKRVTVLQDELDLMQVGDLQINFRKVIQ
jgi:protein phosphatase 1 regulatory subunit 21